MIPLCSGVIYSYNCPHCNIGQYIGSTLRSLHIRTHEHMGISHRTKLPLSNPSYSAIREHCEIVHGSRPIYKDFSIIGKSDDPTSLRIMESLFIKVKKPSLNNKLSSYPLYIS